MLVWCLAMPGGMLGALSRLMANPQAWIEPSAVFAATVLVAWLARRLLLHALGAWATRAQSRPGMILVEALRVPTLIFIAILGVHFAIQASTLPKSVTTLGPKILEALWIIFFTVMCMRIARDLARHYGAKIPGALRVTSLTQNLAQGVVAILGILGLLNQFGVGVAPILTALGVGGLAVALALQDTLSNLFGGFYVAVAGQVRLGDYVKLNTGEEGYVTDIGWRCTTFRALAYNLIIVPNAKLAQAVVTNYYLPEKRMSASFAVTVGNECDPDAVERVLAEVLTQAAGDVPGMLKDPAPSVAFDPGFGEVGLGFTANFHVAEFTNQFSVRNELRKRVLRRFRAEGIGIPYPSRTVYLHGQAPSQSAELPDTKDL